MSKSNRQSIRDPMDATCPVCLFQLITRALEQDKIEIFLKGLHTCKTVSKIKMEILKQTVP